jgi:hypothetical protein
MKIGGKIDQEKISLGKFQVKVASLAWLLFPLLIFWAESYPAIKSWLEGHLSIVIFGPLLYYGAFILLFCRGWLRIRAGGIILDPLKNER